MNLPLQKNGLKSMAVKQLKKRNGKRNNGRTNFYRKSKKNNKNET